MVRMGFVMKTGTVTDHAGRNSTVLEVSRCAYIGNPFRAVDDIRRRSFARQCSPKRIPFPLRGFRSDPDLGCRTLDLNLGGVDILSVSTVWSSPTLVYDIGTPDDESFSAFFGCMGTARPDSGTADCC